MGSVFAAALIFTTTSTPFPQEPTEDAERQETVRYFKTKLSRDDILKSEIDEQQAKKINHFRAVYNPQGELIRIEFVPHGDTIRKVARKGTFFPQPEPPFRYFQLWNPHTRSLDKEILPDRLGTRSFYRASYLDSTHARTVEYFRKKGRLFWTYYLKWDRERKNSKLSVVFSQRLPLTALDPHLFHPAASEMRPGWIAEFTYNRLQRPVGVTVHDEAGNIYYFYRFVHQFETVGDTLNPVTRRIITSEYYRSDSTSMGRHRLIFSENNSLVKKEFFDVRGKLTETVEYEYDREFNEVSVLIRDPEGNILHRQVIPQQ
ncbi:MAG: hypothetical protein ACE5GH_00740 [Fidelibacterota bacterium]